MEEIVLSDFQPLRTQGNKIVSPFCFNVIYSHAIKVSALGCGNFPGLLEHLYLSVVRWKSYLIRLGCLTF